MHAAGLFQNVQHQRTDLFKRHFVDVPPGSILLVRHRSVDQMRWMRQQPQHLCSSRRVKTLLGEISDQPMSFSAPGLGRAGSNRKCVPRQQPHGTAVEPPPPPRLSDTSPRSFRPKVGRASCSDHSDGVLIALASALFARPMMRARTSSVVSFPAIIASPSTRQSTVGTCLSRRMLASACSRGQRRSDIVRPYDLVSNDLASPGNRDQFLCRIACSP